MGKYLNYTWFHWNKLQCVSRTSWWKFDQVSTWLIRKEQNYCRVFVFSLFRVFVFSLFKMLGNTGMVAKATKFLCLEGVSWPNWCLYQVSTWLVSKEQNYCRVFVFSLFRVFAFSLFKMLGNTGMVAKATKFLCLQNVSWSNWCLYRVSTWLVSKEQNYCRVFVFWVLSLCFLSLRFLNAPRLLHEQDKFSGHSTPKCWFRNSQTVNRNADQLYNMRPLPWFLARSVNKTNYNVIILLVFYLESTLEKLSEFHNMKKIWWYCGVIMEKKWSIEAPRKVSISILSSLNGVFHFMESYWSHYGVFKIRFNLKRMHLVWF